MQNDKKKIGILDWALIGAKALLYTVKEITDKKSQLLTRSLVATVTPLAREKWKLDRPILPLSKPIQTMMFQVRLEYGEDGTVTRVTNLDIGDVDITKDFLGGMPKDLRFKGQVLETIMIDKGGEEIFILPPDHEDVAKHLESMAEALRGNEDVEHHIDPLLEKAKAAKELHDRMVSTELDKAETVMAVEDRLEGATPAETEALQKKIGEGLLDKAMTKATGAVGAATLRPLRFKDRPISEADLGSANTVLEEKIDGVGVEMDIPDDGIVTDVHAARSGKVNMIHGLPKIRDHVFHESVRGSKIWMEAKHKQGLHTTTGLLHASRENAAAFVKQHGHPDVYVLGVVRNGGHDTSKLKYDEQRSLRELVSGKIPQGRVPQKCEGTQAEKTAFRDNLFKAARAEKPHVDGVVMLRKTEPLKGQQAVRSKPPQSWDVVLHGHEPSKKIQGAAGAFTYGDNRTVHGKVNIADPQMRVAVFQNPKRYEQKVANVGGLRRSASGTIFQPRLKEIYWEREARSVADWDPLAGLREQVRAMEPDPKKQEGLFQKLKHGRRSAA